MTGAIDDAMIAAHAPLDRHVPEQLAPALPLPYRRVHPAMRIVVVTIAGIAATACAIAAFARVTPPSALIGWIVLVPWLAALDRLHSVRGALAAGMSMSAGFAIAVFPWFPQLIVDYTGAPWVAGAVVLLMLAPVLEPQFVTFALARHLAQRAPDGTRWWQSALVGAGVYVGTEWAWPKLLADTLGHGLHASASLRQAADVAGAHGLTFALIVGNECVLAALRATPLARSPAGSMDGRGWMRRIAAPVSGLALLLASLVGYGSIRLRQLERDPTGKQVRVAMIQANVAHYDRLKAELGTFEAVRQILETHFALSAEALERHKPDILVWPETVYPTTFGTPKSPEGAGFDRAIARFVADRDVPLVFGAYVAEDAKEFNAAILLAPTADGPLVADEYRKTRLFPFTERLPRGLASERVRRWMPWAGTWTPGSGPQVLTVDVAGGRGVRIAPLICYDAVDPDFVIAAVRQGAQLLLTLSNDSWFAFPGVQRLILIVSAFRSIETRRPQLRATPTGVSAVIDASGALLATLDTDQRAILAGTVWLADTAETLMLAWGNWLPPAASIVAFVLLLAAYRRRPSGTHTDWPAAHGSRHRQRRA